MLKYLITFGLAIAAGFAGAQTVTNPAFVAMACAFNTIVPSPTNGTFYFVQCDSAGKVLVSGSAPTGAAGGDLAGTYPDPTLATTQTGAHTWSAIQTFSGRAINSTAGAASAPASIWTGAPFTGGSGTTTFPLVYISTAGATAPTGFSTSGTMFGMNAPSGFAGNLVHLYNNGTTAFNITSAGSVVAAGNFQLSGNTNSFNLRGGGTVISSPTSASLQSGATDVDTGPVAQTFRSQGALTGGTSNVAGANWTWIVSPGKGTGVGGTLNIQTAPAGASSSTPNTPLTTLSLLGTGETRLPRIALDTALTDRTVCADTTNQGLFTGSGALGICLGTSGRQFKRDFAPMPEGLAELMKINFYNYHYLDGYGDNGARRQYGTTAQDVEAVLPELARHNDKGETINYDSGALLVITMRAVQQLKAELDEIKARR